MIVNLTNLRSNSPPVAPAPAPQPKPQAPAPAPAPEIKAPPVPVENEVKSKLWSADAVHRDGQVSAGEVDREQAEFLRETTMLPDD